MKASVNTFTLRPRLLFLTDSLGALLTAILLGFVLVRFEGFFGMPREVLYPLSFLAAFYAVYSFSCYWHLPDRWRPFLRAIAVANLGYCCLTTGLVVYFYPQLTHWGVAYFLTEIIVIISLVLIELHTIRKFDPGKH